MINEKHLLMLTGQNQMCRHPPVSWPTENRYSNITLLVFIGNVQTHVIFFLLHGVRNAPTLHLTATDLTLFAGLM